jgi:rod shape-determining protein MreD
MLALLQATILEHFNVLGAKPDLILISVVIASLYFEAKWALFSSVFAGILKDAMGVYAFGINTLLFPLWAYLIIRLSKKISTDNDFIPAAFIFIVVILHNIIARLIFLSFANSVMPLGVFARITFLGSLYTALVFLLVLRVIRPLLYPVTKPNHYGGKKFNSL